MNVNFLFKEEINEIQKIKELEKEQLQKDFIKYLKKSPPDYRDINILRKFVGDFEKIYGISCFGIIKEGYFSDDPILYEIQERSRPDEMIALKKMEDVVKRLLDGYKNKKSITALDLNCGTGISTRILEKFPLIKKIIGIDIVMRYLEFNKNLIEKEKRLFIQADAYNSVLKSNTIDLAVLSWAYHHIENEKKERYLNNLNNYLKDDGKVIVLENILPFYNNKDSRDKAVEKFYKKVKEILIGNYNDSPRLIVNPSIDRFILNSVDKIVDYEKKKKYEYKVHYNKLKEDFEQSKFKIIEEYRVWPEDNSLEEKAGNFVFVMEKQ